MFYDWLETHNLSANGIALWHAIMQMASRGGWSDNLEISLNNLINRSSLSRSSVYKQRAILKAYGRIDYSILGGSGTTQYKIICFVSTTQTLPSTEKALPSTTCTQNSQENGAKDEFVSTFVSRIKSTRKTQNQSIPLLSNKTKLNNKENNKRKIEVADESAPMPINSSPKKRKKVAPKKEKKSSSLFDPNRWLETVDSSWREAIRQWFEYKSARKQTYKTELGAQKCLAMLKDLSHNNPRTAQAIIDQSIANNWAGLFALRDNGTTSRGQPDPNRPQYGQRIGQIMQTEDEAKRQRIIERLRNAGKVKTQ